MEPLLEAIPAASADLTEGERRTIVAYLDRVTEALEAWRPECSDAP